MLSDMGGIYLLGKQPGTLVADNKIHDITSAYYGGWGLYTDEGSSYVTFERNLSYDCSDNCVHQHYGSLNTFRNNIFAFGNQQIIRITRFEEHVPALFEKNIYLTDGKPIFDVRDRHLKEKTLISHRNLIWDLSGPVVFRGDGGFEQIRALGLEEGSAVADPCFADARARNFELLPESVAFSMGFEPISLDNVGPRR